MKVRSLSSCYLVAASFVLFIGSFGTQLSFGVFLKPLAEQFGWTRAVVAGAMSLLLGVSGFSGVFMGRLTDRYGPRRVVLPGMLAGTVSYLLLYRLGSLWELYLLYGVGAGLYTGSTYSPLVAALSRRFDAQRRTLAIGVALVGIVVGQMVLSPLSAWVIGAHGWRAAWVVLGVVAFVCGLPALWLEDRGGARQKTRADLPERGTGSRIEVHSREGRRTVSESGREVPGGSEAAVVGMTVGEAARTGAFWMLMLTGFVLALGFYAFTAHIVPYATDVGIPSTLAALILTVSSGGGIPGTLLVSALALRMGYRRALIVLTALSTVACLLLMFGGEAWWFYLLAVCFGFGFSAAVPIRMAIAPPLFGTRALGTIIGLSALAFSLGGIIGPLAAGRLFDTTGSYSSAFLVFAVCLAIGVLAVTFLGARRTKQADQEARIWRAQSRLG